MVTKFFFEIALKLKTRFEFEAVGFRKSIGLVFQFEILVFIATQKHEQLSHERLERGLGRIKFGVFFSAWINEPKQTFNSFADSVTATYVYPTYFLIEFWRA